MAAAPQTSIVIRTLNEEAKLGDVLRALQGQTYQDFEVLLVDSGSKDGTVAIAEQFGATILRLDPGSFTFGRALNYGYERARGTYLVSLSGHAIPWCEGWLERLLSHLRAPDVAASTGGGFLPGDSPASRRTRVVRIEAANYKEAPLWGLNNAAGAVKAELWREHRFDEKLTGCEDCEWGWFWMKRGYALIWDEQCSVIHEHHETLPQQYRRSRREYAGLAAFPGDAPLRPTRGTGRVVGHPPEGSGGRPPARVLLLARGRDGGEVPRPQASLPRRLPAGTA